MKALYITDEIDTCDCCGRTDLKATVAMQLSDGGILHYGRTCAARNSGKDQRQIKEEIASSMQDRIDAAYRELQETPARKAMKNKRLELSLRYKGTLTAGQYMRMTESEREAVEQAIQQIAKKYRVPVGSF